MEKRYSPVIFAVLAVFLTFFSVISGNFFTKKVSLQIGEIAKETILAPIQVENEIATNRKKDLAEKEVSIIYKKDSYVQERAIGDIEQLFKYVDTVKNDNIADKLGDSPENVLAQHTTISLYNEQYEALLRYTDEQLMAMKEASITIAGALFDEGISEGEGSKALEIRNALDAYEGLSAQQRKIITDIINYVLAPNVVIDEAATSQAKQLARDKIDPIYVLMGEKIIEQGTRVTEETHLLLSKVGYLDTDLSDRYRQYIGMMVIIGLLMFLCLKVQMTGNTTKKLTIKQLNLVFILYTIGIGLTRLMLSISFIYLPISMIGIMISFAISINVAVIVQMVLIGFAAMIFKGDLVFVFYFTMTGIASIFVVRNMLERKKAMANALVVGSIQMLAYFSIKLFVGSTLSVSLIQEAVLTFIMGIIEVILVVGALPVLESIFGFVTPMQLLELTDPNQPILKKLLLQATGTYYHSLLVANLAESAADAIGANPLMARVGGYYHDIGKLKHINYFKENQGKENPHDYLSPYESHDKLVSHVLEGVELAKEYQLPTYVQDMILQHHGTSVTHYFYVKAKELYGETVTEDEFRYPGPKPRTKEAALVMLADVVEATVRAMQDQLGEDLSIEDLVNKMVRQKLKEGQLDDCQLYISDIDKIIASFSKVLKGMYHERIKYPEGKTK